MATTNVKISTTVDGRTPQHSKLT